MDIIRNSISLFFSLKTWKKMVFNRKISKIFMIIIKYKRLMEKQIINAQENINI